MSTHAAYIELLAYNRLGLRDETLQAARKILNGTPNNVWEFREAVDAAKTLDGNSAGWRKLARATYRRMTPLHQDVTRGDLQRFLSKTRPKQRRIAPPKGPRLTLANCPDDLKVNWMYVLMERHLDANNKNKATALRQAIERHLRKVKQQGERNLLHELLAKYHARFGQRKKAEQHLRAIQLDAWCGPTRSVQLVLLKLADALQLAKKERALIESHLRQRRKPVARGVLQELEIAAITIDYYIRQLERLGAFSA